MNALLLNQMLMSSHNSNSRNQGGYGSLGHDEPSPLQPLAPLTDTFPGSRNTEEGEEALDQLPPMQFQAQNNQQESDIWNVPTESQYHSRYDRDDFTH